MLKQLTEKQEKILGFIREKTGENGLPPTIREIAARFNFSSTGTVRDYLRTLAAKGFLRISKRKARGLELSSKATGIPILGRVMAGIPGEAVEDIEGFIQPGDFFQQNEHTFALRVKGDSMQEAGIMEDDCVLVKRQGKAQNNEIVVAMVGDEATVKVLKEKEDGWFLCPANSRYKPIPCTESTKIIGKVTGVVRKYI